LARPFFFARNQGKADEQGEPWARDRTLIKLLLMRCAAGCVSHHDQTFTLTILHAIVRSVAFQLQQMRSTRHFDACRNDGLRLAFD